jgi:hypothetical protein
MSSWKKMVLEANALASDEFKMQESVRLAYIETLPKPSADGLRQPASEVLARLPGRFIRTTAHDPEDKDSTDLLWFEINHPDDHSEGCAMSIGCSGDTWFADYEDALKYGRWETVWSASGSSQEIVEEICGYLSTYSTLDE